MIQEPTRLDSFIANFVSTAPGRRVFQHNPPEADKRERTPRPVIRPAWVTIGANASTSETCWAKCRRFRGSAGCSDFGRRIRRRRRLYWKRSHHLDERGRQSADTPRVARGRGPLHPLPDAEPAGARLTETEVGAFGRREMSSLRGQRQEPVRVAEQVQA